MADKTVLVLGGGVGGLVAASELRRRLGKDHRVVLLDRTGQHVFSPSFVWLIVGLRDPEKIVRSLDSLQRKGIEVVQAEITAIDPARHSVQANGREWTGDYVVVSLGAQLAPEVIPGLAEAGHNLYTIEGATAIRDARRGLASGRLVVLTAGVPYKCPAAPYEAALLLEYDLRKRKLRDRVEVAVYAAEPAPMGVAGPEVAAGVRQMLQERNIAYYPQHQVTRVDPATRTLYFANGTGNAAEAHFDLLVYVPPHRAPAVLREAGLTGEAAWVPVDRHTLATPFPGVYAVGDMTGIPLAMGQLLPKAGVFAHRQAEVVAQNIAAEIAGRGSRAAFDGHGECFVEAGDGKAAFGRGNFYAEPRPTVKLYQPGRHWHAGKVLFEKDWLRRWF